MNATIKEVAKEAGVSISTVSRVLNGKDKVKKATRQKVERAIERTGYRPDHIARSMIMKTTKTIGLIVPVISNQYWALLSEIIEERVGMAGYTLMLFITGDDESGIDKEASVLNALLERHVDGAIYASGKNPDKIKQFLDYGIPLVSFQKNISGVSRVSGDNLRGSMEATEHLVDLGHKDIAFIGGPPNAVDRELGYRNAHTVNHLAVNESLVKQAPHFTVECGYDAAKTLLEHKGKFTSVFCANDLLAFGAIQALEQDGIDVPQDIAVVGFDDIEPASFFKPALTTVRQPIREMGITLVDLLIEAIDHADGAAPPSKNIVFPMELVVRESCGDKSISRPVEQGSKGSSQG